MTDLDILIRDLEGAPEGSRKLDGRIDVAVMDADGEQWPAHYTTSLDAALTLVPEGWIVAELKQRVRHTVWHWYCALSYLTAQMEAFDILPDTEAPTPALALCIAAMKARSAA